MINALTYPAGGLTVQFPANPIRTGPDLSLQRFQTMAHDSDGTPYIYGKSGASAYTHPLTFTNVSGAVLGQLKGLIRAVSGNKTAFTWYDHDAAAHTARFNGGLRYAQTAADKYRISFSLDEVL